MEMTDKQRAWWFANHPEYSRDHKGSKRSSRAHTDKGSSKIRAGDVDAYVDNALQYADESVAQLLKSIKRNYGTASKTGAKSPGSSTSGDINLPEETWKDKLLWHYVDFKNTRRNFLSTMDQARQRAIENLEPIFPHKFSPPKMPGYKDAVDFVDRYWRRFNYLSDSDDEDKKAKIHKAVKKGAELLDEAEKVKGATGKRRKKISSQEDEAKSDIPKIGGRRPINYELAGQTHRSGVEFHKQGFPDFEPHAIETVTVEGLTGNRTMDARLANKAAGLSKTPKGYIWHHDPDGRTMRLVRENKHQPTGHTGGAAVIKHRRKKHKK